MPAKQAYSDSEVLNRLVRERNVRGLVKGLFRHDLTPGQVAIAASIAFPKPTKTRDGVVGSRVAVVSPTQYGKTQAFADGLGLRFILDPRPLRVKGIGPREAQARIFRDRMAQNILAQSLLSENLDVPGGGIQRIKKEVSQRRFTFRDGKELSLLSAEGDADRAMGEGADIVVKDEACLINDEAHAKVGRMLTANPRAELYELANPWDRENTFARHWEDPSWTHIHVTLDQALAEGRLTRAFVEEQRRELAPTLFQVMFEARFPDIAEDQLIPWSHVQKAVRHGEFMPTDAWTLAFGADIAEGGMDKTVLSEGYKQDRRLALVKQTAWKIADTMETAGRIAAIAAGRGIVGVDENGPGKGVADRLPELGASVLVFKGGRQAMHAERFVNLVSECLWDLRRGFEEGLIELWNPSNALLGDLTKWRWELQAGRIRVKVDGGKQQGASPDHGDSLAYLYWSGGRGVEGPKFLRRPRTLI